MTNEHLSLIAHSTEHELSKIRDVIAHPVMVEERGDVEALLSSLWVRGNTRFRTLDLIGHSTPGKALLSLGHWVIDGYRSAVVSFFRGLADSGLIEHLGIEAIRLLGCETACTPEGRATICRLAAASGIEVYGTKELIYSAHYDAAGLRDACAHVLVSATELAETNRAPLARAKPYRRTLDVETLAAFSVVESAGGRSCRIASRDTGSALLGLVRRSDGAVMPGLLVPSHELALPATMTGRYHRLQVLLDGTFVRVYPDGLDNPGVAFPVDDPGALLELVESLPESRVVFA